MNALHWIARHPFYTWLLLSAAFTVGWTVYLGWFGESDEARDARRRRESAERAKQRLRATTRDFQATERERALRAYDARANRVVREVLDEDAVAFRLDVPRDAA